MPTVQKYSLRQMFTKCPNGPHTHSTGNKARLIPLAKCCFNCQNGAICETLTAQRTHARREGVNGAFKTIEGMGPAHHDCKAFRVIISTSFTMRPTSSPIFRPANHFGSKSQKPPFPSRKFSSVKPTTASAAAADP